MGSIPVERITGSDRLTSHDDERFMREALLEAHEGYRRGEVPVGAVIVKDGLIIGRGHNLRETSGDPLGHAELVALRNASESLGDWRLEGCVMYVTLEPCPMCAGALLASRIEKVVYGACDEKEGACGTVLNVADYPGLGRKALIIGGILEDECAGMLKKFFRDKRKGTSRPVDR